MRSVKLFLRNDSLMAGILSATLTLLFVIFTFTTASAQTEPKADPWSSWRFLLGEWVSSPDGSGSTGGVTFSADLQDKILMCRNHAEYPATEKTPAINYQNLGVIYHEGDKPVQASFFDNEGHVIRYVASFSKAEDTLMLTSEVVPNAPRFRLSYIKLGGDSLKVDFGIAAPGQPDSFMPYRTGVIRKK